MRQSTHDTISAEVPPTLWAVNRTERLVNLVAYLTDAPRPRPASEIMASVPGYAQGGEAARRSFERDKDTLRELGLPIEAVPIDPLHGMDPDNVGYVLPAPDPVDDPGLTVAERSALAVAAAVALGDAGPLAGALHGDTPPVSFSGRAAPPLVEAIIDAVAECRQVELTYETPGPPPVRKQRRVSPYGVVHRRGNWYMVGADSHSGEQRSFRLDRVVGDVRVGAAGAFSRPPGLDLGHAVADRGWERGDAVAVDVTIGVDPHWWWWVAPQAQGIPGPTVEVGGTQWPTLTLRVRDPEAFVTWILSLLDAAVVVSDGPLRDEVIARLEGIDAAMVPGR